AAAGVTVDLFTAGLSLGAAALTGAIAGGLWQSANRLGKRVIGRVQGYREITVDDAVLRLLAVRQLALLEALQRRGHAALAPIVIDPLASTADLSVASPAGESDESRPELPYRIEGAAGNRLRSGKLPDALAEARSQP